MSSILGHLQSLMGGAKASDPDPVAGNDQSPLQQLLGSSQGVQTDAAPQQAGSISPDDSTAVPQDVQGNDITVKGSTPDRSVTPDDRDQPSHRATTELVQHHGLFGIKGTLRDILGTVGDAFLTQGGKNTVYAPQRAEEKQGSALYDVNSNPMAAVNRLAAQGFPDQAKQLYESIQTNQLRKSQAQSLADNRAATATKTLMNPISGLMAGAKNAQDYAARYAQAQKMAERGGTDLDSLGIDPNYSPEAVARAHDMGISSLQQDRLDQQSENETGRNSRNENTVNAANQRAANWNQTYEQTHPARPAPVVHSTAMDQAKPLLDKIKNGGTLTDGEKQVLDRVAPGRKKNALEVIAGMSPGGGSGTAPTANSVPNPMGGSKFTPGQTVYRGGKAFVVNPDGKTARPK